MRHYAPYSGRHKDLQADVGVHVWVSEAFLHCLLQMSSETLKSVMGDRCLEGVLDYKWVCTVGGTLVLDS